MDSWDSTLEMHPESSFSYLWQVGDKPVKMLDCSGNSRVPRQHAEADVKIIGNSAKLHCAKSEAAHLVKERFARSTWVFIVYDLPTSWQPVLQNSEMRVIQVQGSACAKVEKGVLRACSRSDTRGWGFDGAGWAGTQKSSPLKGSWH